MACDPQDAMNLRWVAIAVLLLTLWAVVSVIDLAWLHFTDEGRSVQARARREQEVERE